MRNEVNVCKNLDKNQGRNIGAVRVSPFSYNLSTYTERHTRPYYGLHSLRRLQLCHNLFFRSFFCFRTFATFDETEKRENVDSGINEEVTIRN